MKFGLTLQNTSGVYSQFETYKTLKKFISNLSKSPKAGTEDQSSQIFASQLWWFDESSFNLPSLPAEEMLFIRHLDAEIKRVRRLHESKSQELKDLLTNVFRRIHGKFSMETLRSDLDIIADELVKLEHFVRTSKILFYKILKKHDKHTHHVKVGSWMLVTLEQEAWWSPRFDALIVGLNDAYAEIRAYEAKQKQGESAPAATTESPRGGGGSVESFERKTLKYFVRPEDIMLIKMMIIKHLPIDIFDRKPNATTDYRFYMDSVQHLHDAAVINSIYLDNQELDMYHDRIPALEKDRGNLIRIRWYGDHVNPTPEVYVERKTRVPHGHYTIDEAVKERFPIKSEKVLPYLKGEWDIQKKLEKAVKSKSMKPEAADKLRKTSLDIQAEILTKHLFSAVRTVCRRTAFQQGRDASVRLSLDTNLHMLDELNGMEPNKWFRNMEKALPTQSVAKFPFAVLEVKLQVAEAPQWVQNLQNCGRVFYAERFSKFLYGTIKLRPEKVRFSPYWIEHTSALEKEKPSSTVVMGKIEIKGELPPVESVLVPDVAAPAIPISAAVQPSTATVEKGKTKPAFDSLRIGHADEDADSEGDALLQRTASNSSQSSSARDSSLSSKLDIFGSRRKSKEVNLVLLEGGSKTGSLSNIPPPLSVKRKKSAPDGGPRTPRENPEDTLEVKNKQRIAKTYFANERTLLQWVNTVTFLALTGITLLATDSQVGRVSGISLISVTILFAAYALSRYRMRLRGLESYSMGGFADRYGPVVLVAIFCVVLVFIGSFYGFQNAVDIP
jgi:SPX domain protein involved in polyphosphate accumulation/uncharacterized membrane protein YidH (DUF202 family)